MKLIILGLINFAFAGVVLKLNWLEIQSAVQEGNYTYFQLLEVVFLVGIGLYLFAASRSPQVKEEPGEIRSFLTLLQEKGRLLDFALDDITPYSDEQVGKVARVVHQGVKEALANSVSVEPVFAGQEGETVSIQEQTDNFRFVGQKTGKPPFSGKVLHRGWRAKSISLPKANTDTDVIQPAEIEVNA